MVKDISKENTSYDFGHLSISVDELINLIDEKGFKKVRAKNKGFEFEGIEDMKSNKSLLSGEPLLYLDDVMISFERFSRSVRPYANSSDISTAKSFNEDLLRRKTFIDYFMESKLLEIKYLILSLALSALLPYFLKRVGVIENTISYTSVIFNAYTAVFALKFAVEGYSNFIREPVYHRPTQGFFKRNAESIVVSAISGLIGVLIGAVGSSVIEKIRLWL